MNSYSNYFKCSRFNRWKYPRVKIGTHNDLQLFHDSNNSIIQHSGTGSLQLKSDSVTLTFPNSGGNITEL